MYFRINCKRFLATLFVPFAILLSVQGVSAQTPRLDPATPKSQDGFTVVAITRGDSQGQYKFPVPAGYSFLSGPQSSGAPFGIGLWIEGPKIAPKKMGNGSYYYNGTPMLQAYFHVGNMPDSASSISNVGFPMQNSQSPQIPLYLLTIPLGYPSTAHTADITVGQQNGKEMKWRLTDLPTSYHAINGLVALHSIYSKNGVSLTASAWRYPNVKQPSFGSLFNNYSSVQYRVTGHVPVSTNWALQIEHSVLEWEAPPQTLPKGYPVQFGQYNSYEGSALGYFGNIGLADPRFMHNTTSGQVQTPYANSEHYLKLTGELHKLAGLKEILVFHDLNVRSITEPGYPKPPMIKRGKLSYPAYTPPASNVIYCKPQTVVTPSGISVTLLPYSDIPKRGFGGFYGNNWGVNVLLRFNNIQPNRGFQAITHSSIYRSYHKPEEVALTQTSPMSFQNLIPTDQQYFGSQSHNSPQMYVLSLAPNMQSRPVTKTINGRTFTTFEQPAAPKFIKTLTLTLTQIAYLSSQPVSFLVPVKASDPTQPQHPPMQIINGRRFPFFHPTPKRMILPTPKKR